MELEDVGVSGAETKRTINTDPGASRHGNFINYYQFHPARDRVEQLPRDVWHADSSNRKYVGLDVGCNSGELTQLLFTFLKNNLSNDEEIEVSLLGVDLDPVLIERAIETNAYRDHLTYQQLDITSRTQLDESLDVYLNGLKVEMFDVAFCFSITMWIHLNNGDEGLRTFLERICERCLMIVVEPQPWKCYRNASRRLRRAGAGSFPLMDELTYRNDVDERIEQILTDHCSFRKVTVSAKNDWGRYLLIYERPLTKTFKTVRKRISTHGITEHVPNLRYHDN